MLIDVQDPIRNIILNACFYAIILLGLIGMIPWNALGAARISRLLRLLVVPVLGLMIVYEAAMPSRFNIRVDLFMLVPAYAAAVITSLFRWITWWRAA